jgi:hypothetical protein
MISSLKQLKFVLQDVLKRLEWRTENVNISNTTFLQFDNLGDVREVINVIAGTGLFEDIITELRNSAIFTSASNQIRVQVQEGRLLSQQLDLFKALLDNFLSVLLNTVPDEDPSSINIKLPPINNFDDLAKVSRDIHIALGQIVYNEEINGQEEIVSVENGSIWLNVLIGSTAVGVIASIVWSAAVIYKKFQEGRLLEQQIRSLQVKNDSLEDVLKAQKAHTELAIQAEADHIQSEHFSANVPENVERIKNSITIFAELIGRGAEIHPALVAPENVSNLFPDPTKLIGLESKIKRIAGSGNN